MILLSAPWLLFLRGLLFNHAGRVPCRLLREIIFTWHPSEHGSNLDVKWNQKAILKCEPYRQNGVAKDHAWLHTATAIAGLDRT